MPHINSQSMNASLASMMKRQQAQQGGAGAPQAQNLSPAQTAAIQQQAKEAVASLLGASQGAMGVGPQLTMLSIRIDAMAKDIQEIKAMLKAGNAAADGSVRPQGMTAVQAKMAQQLDAIAKSLKL